jgi:hypothetical protein
VQVLQINGGSTQRYYRCTANRKRGTCTNRLSVCEGLTKQRVLEAIGGALSSPESVAYIRRRLAERLGSLSRDSATEATERTARLERTEERIRGLIVMQAEGDRSHLVAQMRSDLEAQAEAERTAVEELRAQATAPIRLPPVELLTDRVLALKALTDSPDVERARAALKRYLRDGTITLSPDVGPDGKPAYVARAQFLPLVLLTENAETPSEGYQGGRCPRWVARGRNAGCIPRYRWGLSDAWLHERPRSGSQRPVLSQVAIASGTPPRSTARECWRYPSARSYAARWRMMSRRIRWILLGCALCACHSGRISEVSRAAPALRCEPFADVDHLLYYRRAALCRQLGEAVPVGAGPKPSELPKDSAGVLSACEAGNSTACFWAADQAARGLVVGADGELVERKPPDVGRGIELFRKSCAGDDDNGCLWLAGQLRDHRPAELAPFLLELCRGERSEACARSVYALEPARHGALLRSAVRNVKQRLEQACLAGSSESCSLREEMDGQEQVPNAQRRWRLEACRRGAPYACVQQKLPQASLDAVRELSDEACATSADCPGLLARLRAACLAGNAAGCYLSANACKNDELLPDAVECNPVPVALCSAPEEPTTNPPSCLARSQRGALLLDERAYGVANGWRVYQSCPWNGSASAKARQSGYLFEHAGEVMASSEQLHSILEQHRGALQVGQSIATGLGVAGPMATIEGDVRIEKVLPMLKRSFSDVPTDLCFGIQIETWNAPPVAL